MEKINFIIVPCAGWGRMHEQLKGSLGLFHLKTDLLWSKPEIGQMNEHDSTVNRMTVQ